MKYPEGTLVRYDTGLGSIRYGVTCPHPYKDNESQVWGYWADTAEEAQQLFGRKTMSLRYVVSSTYLEVIQKAEPDTERPVRSFGSFIKKLGQK